MGRFAKLAHFPKVDIGYPCHERTLRMSATGGSSLFDAQQADGVAGQADNTGYNRREYQPIESGRGGIPWSIMPPSCLVP